MMRIKLAIIEDNVELMNSMIEYFNSTGEFNIVRTTLSIEEFIHEPVSESPDIILLDLMLPGMKGMDGIPYIRELYPAVTIVVNSVLDDSESIFTSLKRGASGYITKGTSFDKIKNVLVSAFNGMSVMNQAIAGKVLEYFEDNSSVIENLSVKELHIAEALKIGMSYKMIAIDNKVTIDAVRFHVRNIYRKLQINSKGELISLMLAAKSVRR